MKRLYQPTPPAEINLLPMMDVLLSVLTFFVIISMTLTSGQPIINVTLPPTAENDASASDKDLPDPLMLGIDVEGRVVYQDQTLDETALKQQLKTYFDKTPKGVVLLQADQELTYKKIAVVLNEVRQVGGDRVALAVNEQPLEEN